MDVLSLPETPLGETNGNHCYACLHMESQTCQLYMKNMETL